MAFLRIHVFSIKVNPLSSKSNAKDYRNLNKLSKPPRQSSPELSEFLGQRQVG